MMEGTAGLIWHRIGTSGGFFDKVIDIQLP